MRHDREMMSHNPEMKYLLFYEGNNLLQISTKFTTTVIMAIMVIISRIFTLAITLVEKKRCRSTRNASGNLSLQLPLEPQTSTSSSSDEEVTCGTTTCSSFDLESRGRCLVSANLVLAWDAVCCWFVSKKKEMPETIYHIEERVGTTRVNFVHQLLGRNVPSSSCPFGCRLLCQHYSHFWRRQSASPFSSQALPSLASLLSSFPHDSSSSSHVSESVILSLPESVILRCKKNKNFSVGDSTCIFPFIQRIFRAKHHKQKDEGKHLPSSPPFSWREYDVSGHGLRQQESPTTTSETSTRECIIITPTCLASSSEDSEETSEKCDDELSESSSRLTFCWTEILQLSICHSVRQPHQLQDVTCLPWKEVQETAGNEHRLQRGQHPSQVKQQESHYCDRHEGKKTTTIENDRPRNIQSTMKTKQPLKKIQDQEDFCEQDKKKKKNRKRNQPAKNKSQGDRGVTSLLVLLLISLPSLLISVSCSHLTITLVSAEQATAVPLVSSSSSSNVHSATSRQTASSSSSRSASTGGSASGQTSSSTSGDGAFFSGERRLSPRTVTTNYGSLRGVTMSLPNRSLQPVEAFLGVPYAASPTGKLRFMPPVTPDVWSGIRTVDRPGSVCPQTLTPSSTLLYRFRSSSSSKPTFASSSSSSSSQPTMEEMFKNETELLKIMTPAGVQIHQRMKQLLQNQSEDCLFLNIYVPVSVMNSRGTEGSRVPVLVFIAGDSFSSFSGGSLFDGSVLSSFGNIVVVTINFRLGILGFLPALDGGASRGNFGLMDQVAALHWVQENIGEFGGDASNVTLAGHGYGAACANLLMVSPMVRGLFRRVIMMSGSALSPWSISTMGVKYAREVASFLGCPSEAKKYHLMVECLRRKSVDELLSAEPISPSYLSTFGPTIDSATIRGDPLASMMSPETSFGDYDLMLGVTKMESYDMFNAEDEREGIDANRRDRILRTLIRNLFSYRLQEIFLTISNEYTDWTKTSTSSSNNNQHPLMESVSEAVGDATIVAPMIRTALIHSKRSRESKTNGKTYFYNFAYTANEESGASSTSSSSLSGSSASSRMTSLHGQELPFVFGVPLVSSAVVVPSPSSSPMYTSSSFTSSSSSSLSSYSHLGFFETRVKYSRAEAGLSEAVMNYWVNFVRSGNPSSTLTAMNPNEESFVGTSSGRTGSTSSSSSSSSQSSSSFMSPSSSSTTDKSNSGIYSMKTSDSNRLTTNRINWPLFDEHHQQYLSISLKPKVKDHYHAHKLSYWLNLIPKLNHAGPKTGSSSLDLHLLQDHENPSTYEGVVRETRSRPASGSPSSGSFAYGSPSGSSSLRSPSQLHFVNGSFIPLFEEDSRQQHQQQLQEGSEVDSSKIVSSSIPLNPPPAVKGKTSSSSSDLLESNSIEQQRNSNNINDNEDNNSRSVNSNIETKSGNNNSGGNTSSSSSRYQQILSLLCMAGLIILVANVVILLRERHKKTQRRERRLKSRDAANNGRKQSISRDSSPSSTNQQQLHLMQSHHRQHHHILLNESIDDLCAKQDAINQVTLCAASSGGTVSSSGHLHHYNQQESLDSPASGMTGLSFHPELISGHHHLHQFSSLHRNNSQLHHNHVYPEGILNGVLEVRHDERPDVGLNGDYDVSQDSSSPGLHVWTQLPVQQHLQQQSSRAARLVSQGSSFNSNNSSSSTVTSSSVGHHTLNHVHNTNNHHNHSHNHHHASSTVHLNASDFCTTVSSASSSPLTTSGTLTRNTHEVAAKKVSFVSPSESLILYDNDSKIQTDTQV